jgi:hypothetical protein
MTFALVLAIVAGLVSWLAVGYAIWQWGPGLRKRSLWCPTLKKQAKVLGDQREADFVCSYAGLKVVDVQYCSLLKGPPLMCDKACLQHL